MNYDNILPHTYHIPERDFKCVWGLMLQYLSKYIQNERVIFLEISNTDTYMVTVAEAHYSMTRVT